VRAGASFGVVSGYRTNLVPLAIPTAMWEGKTFGLNVLFVPAYDGQPSGVGLQLKVRLP